MIFKCTFFFSIVKKQMINSSICCRLNQWNLMCIASTRVQISSLQDSEIGKNMNLIEQFSYQISSDSKTVICTVFENDSKNGEFQA